MSFTNLQVDLDTLPRFDAVRFQTLHACYPRIVLGLAVAFEIPALLGAAFVLLAASPPAAIRSSIGAALLLAAVFVAWLAHKSASVMRYAVRRHDVVLRTGVFWRKETVQPIKRIQHVEQVQGPVDKKFGLSKIKLFSAGTGHVTFEIPGLDAEMAAAIKRYILSYHEPDGEASPGAPDGSEAPQADGARAKPAGNAEPRRNAQAAGAARPAGDG